MMKNLFKIGALALAMTAVSTSCGDKVVLPTELPVQIQTFVQQHFPDLTVSYASRERKLLGSTYEVVLTDGTMVDFDTDLQWDKVQRTMLPVPDGIVPAPIAAHVAANFPGVPIVKIDRERYGYEVELANDLDLKFNKQGAITEVDD